MRKYLSSILVCMLFSFAMVPFAHGENPPGKPRPGQTQTPPQTQPQTPPQQQEVKLTEAQKTELAKLHKDILEKKKEMVHKYVEFGVIPEDKGQMMIKHFEKHYEMLEQNGFVLRPMPHQHPRGTKPTPSKPQP
jgi:hypothetical protein